MFISAYGPGSEKSEEEIEEFWNELSESVGSFGRNESVVVPRDLNARMGNEVIEGIVGRHGVPGRIESGERLLEMCAEQELVVGNSWFKKNDVQEIHVVENGGRKGGRQGTNGLCVVTKTNGKKKK